MSREADTLKYPADFDGHMFLRSRRSVRYYQPEIPASEILERIFASAAAAPSAHNRQPWRFLVVTDHQIKTRLAVAMGTRLTADRRRDGDLEAAITKDVERSFQRITSAPVVILVALTLSEMDAYRDEARARAEWLMAVQSTAMAGQNLLLAAQAEGLGACWMCAPLFCETETKQALALPDDWQVQGLITLGFPARPPSLRPRKLLSEVMVFHQPGRKRRFDEAYGARGSPHPPGDSAKIGAGLDGAAPYGSSKR